MADNDCNPSPCQKCNLSEPDNNGCAGAQLTIVYEDEGSDELGCCTGENCTCKLCRWDGRINVTNNRASTRHVICGGTEHDVANGETKPFEVSETAACDSDGPHVTSLPVVVNSLAGIHVGTVTFSLTCGACTQQTQ